MGSCPGRAGIGAILTLLCAGSLVPRLARAQDDEVIVDPELAASGVAPSAAEGSEQVIVDPELAGSSGAEPSQPAEPEQDFGWGKVLAKKEPPPEPVTSAEEASDEEDYDPLANTGIAKLELLAQFASDLRHEYALEDAYETRIRFGGEIEFRRSRTLRLVLGSRVDFYWAAPSQNDPVVVQKKERALDEDRYEVDVLPTAAYIDSTLGDGFHLRVGHQVVSLGRMDFYSPTDVLVA